MGKSRLNYDDRKVIEKMLSVGKNFQEIGNELSRNRSTIDREVERNLSEDGKYCALYAQLLYEERKVKKRKKTVSDNPEVIAFVSIHIKNYTPDIIAGRLTLEQSYLRVSTESIYRIIYNDSVNGIVSNIFRFFLKLTFKFKLFLYSFPLVIPYSYI
jgi:transposase, IS30 family